MSETDAPEKITVKFIRDEPSETDFFGSHSRVATAVAEVIGDDNDIHVVGLLGSWGSGKSTVVSQIQKQLSARRDNIHFFNYDAWLYQNDPPRRSFLEALIQDLVQNSLSGETQWQERLADLSGRSEETVTETSRKLSLTGKWILGSLGLVPIGTVVLGRALDPKNIKDAPWMIWTGTALTLAPVVIAALFYLCWRPWRQNWFRGIFKSHFWVRHREPYGKQSILALLTNQSVERTEKKTKISPEPSVTEFRTVFRDILKSLRAKRERLIIVIDNLDRLAEAEALELWATIRSLFLGSTLNGIQRSELTLPTIILPIDEGSVQRIFRASEGHEARELARSFMDKTFDVSFYINDPVMSDWRAFLREKLEQAFGTSATDERVYWATKFVEDHAAIGSSSKKITPRSLVKLVNSVGVLIKQWGDGSIDFLSMVFFALHRMQINEDLRQFVNKDWPNADAAIKEWQRDIVALHYGVPREKAFQALLQEPLRLAISAKDEAEFSRLCEVVGFGPIFEEVIANPPASMPGQQTDFIANAALLVAGSDVSHELWAKRGMQNLASIWCDSGQPTNFRADFANAVRVLAPFTTEQRFLQASVGHLSASLPKSGISKDIAKNFVTALEAIQEAEKLISQKSPLVQLTLDPKNLFVLLEEVPSNLRPMIGSDKGANELVSTLSTWLENESESGNVANATRALASSVTIQFKDKVKPNWDSIVGTAYNTISGNTLSFHATGPAIDVLGILHSKNQNAKTHVEQLFDQGHLANRLNEADQAKDSPRLGDIAALMFLRGSDFAAPNGKTWDQVTTEDKEFVGNFDTALAWYMDGNRATFTHQGLQSRPSLKPIICELIKRDISEKTASGLTTDHLLTNIKKLDALIGTELLGKALSQASVRADFWPTFEKLKDGRPYDDAVMALSEVDAVDRSKLIENVKIRLAGHDAGTWKEAIFENVSPYNLAEIFGVTMGQSDPLGDGLRTALTDALLQLPQSDEGVRERWFFLSRFVSKDTRATLFKNLRDKIHSGTEFSDFAHLMRSGGSQILNEGKFEEFADKTIRHLTIPLLSTEIGLVYLAENIRFFSSCLAASDEETKNAVQEALLTAQNEFGEVEHDAVETVTSEFSVILKRSKEPAG
ncbi:P-loop NTPase fold protein [Sphingobium fluviale]|uniref:KAP NTPase domain-containing protein n=1 Tax=Sphingobium fluviale TaxID=2506423 RepID=A0A4Q1KDI8_9SPHN|nr:P-loop NTPase fold protein [Sphingobium fluviale]RXR24942.1 hypothetical protein EQG66_14705 [Sphingobium fluviale]